MYMAIKTSFGLFRVGRFSAGIAGLGLWGYGASPVEADRAPFDTEQPSDRIVWMHSMGPLTIAAGYDKFYELDSWMTTEEDGDLDDYFVVLIYRFANGNFNASWVGYRNRMFGADSDIHRFDVAATLKFGPLAFNGEIQYRTGETEVVGASDIDETGLGIYLDLVYKYGPGEVGVQYLWVQGDDDPLDDEDEANVAAGDDYEPLILFLEEGIAVTGLASTIWGSGGNTANWWHFGFWWDHSLTEDLLLHAAYGYFKVNEVADTQVKADGSEYDDTLGSEIDIGIKYNVMKNLTYTAIFAYFMPGDYIKDAAETELLGRDVGNAYMFRHELKISF
jgi:hypothetical protein